eukprot:CAMPEP_0118991932 /NCGR_PEP_ID=MMETSP1173-20130426/52533_1 /TAXON_ID=1034831 /ORGANISM="Rhizochromulina marina cf, Strain CCMP1243" /LENGTH=86 /DNA_ID=CAMNT_0006943085 /DNA_START=20 /DNA_END=280 /DNA_ORIENTATION=+
MAAVATADFFVRPVLELDVAQERYDGRTAGWRGLGFLALHKALRLPSPGIDRRNPAANIVGLADPHHPETGELRGCAVEGKDLEPD